MYIKKAEGSISGFVWKSPILDSTDGLSTTAFTHCNFLPLQSRLPGIKVKYLLVVWLGIFVGSWVAYMHYSSYSELCRGHICRMIIVSNGVGKG